jgi:SepF-like predicted cell division protein (DUF552 family)
MDMPLLKKPMRKGKDDVTPVETDQYIDLGALYTNELKNVARDTGGDVAAIGNNLIVVTPSGIKVDRHKLKGGYD